MRPWWCFDKSIRKTYYPFPGCEASLPQKLQQRQRKRFLSILNDPDYIGQSCASLKSESLKRVLFYDKTEHNVERCVFEYNVSPAETCFMYCVFLDDKNFNFCEVYVSKSLKEIETSFSILLKKTDH